MKTGRSFFRQLSARRLGSSPLPAMMPRVPAAAGPALSAIRPFRLADGPVRISADERHDIVYRGNAAEAFCDFVDTLVQRSLVGEKAIIGAAQSLDVVATKAAALHA